MAVSLHNFCGQKNKWNWNASDDTHTVPQFNDLLVDNKTQIRRDSGLYDCFTLSNKRPER